MNRVTAVSIRVLVSDGEDREGSLLTARCGHGDGYGWASAAPPSYPETTVVPSLAR